MQIVVATRHAAMLSDVLDPDHSSSRPVTTTFGDWPHEATAGLSAAARVTAPDTISVAPGTVGTKHAARRRGGPVAGELRPVDHRRHPPSHLTGEEPRADLVDLLGGWPAIETLAPVLVDDPLLPVTVMLLTRGIDQGTWRTSCRQRSRRRRRCASPGCGRSGRCGRGHRRPGLFATTMNTLCSHAALADIVGEQLAAACAALAVRRASTAPRPAKPRRCATPSPWSRGSPGRARTRRTATACSRPHVESTSLSHCATPARSRAPSRVAYDHWNAADGADDVADVLDILTGVTPAARTSAAQPRGGRRSLAARDTELRLVIAPDAAWTKAG